MKDPSLNLREQGEDVNGLNASDDGARYELVTESGTDYPSESPIHWLRRVLRGRYRLAVALAALVGCIGALAGYLAQPAKYESRGLVRIEKAPPAILYPSRASQAQPDFDAHIAAEVAHLQSRRVVEAAARGDALQHAGWPAGATGVARLHKALTVRRPRGESFIYVSVTHTDPSLAHAAVNAVLDTYRESPIDSGGLSLTAKDQALVLRQESLEKALLQVRTEILEATDQYGREAIERIHAAKVEELMDIDRKLAELRMTQERILAGQDATPTSTSGESQQGTNALSALRQHELALVAEIKSSRYRPGHPVLQRLGRNLDAVRIQIDLYEQARRGRSTEGGQPAVDSSALAELDRLEAWYQAARIPLRREAEKFGRLRVTVAGLGEHESELKQRLSLTRQRLDEIRFEAGRGNADRISIARGELPVAPVFDRRRALAAAGLLMGMLGGLGIVILIGLADPRVRFADELEAMDLPAPVVAVLPELVGRDPAREQWAVRNLQQVRSALELASRDPDRKVHTVTSSAHGEGRTDVAHALATCFAAAGRKTLVIDADFVSPRLSAEIKLDSRTGLCEALTTGTSSDHIHPTDQPNLWGMPIGSGEGLNARHLSPDGLGRLLDTLRGRFDAIVIDTPPVLAAAEASLVAALSDSSVIVVARNQKAELIRAAAARLRHVGAEVVGLVLNKAGASDLSFGQTAVSDMLQPFVTPRSDSAVPDDTGPIGRIADEQAADTVATPQERKRAA
ncbi:MAG: tyrosine-protein kinase domain-containing protein [Planctomycetota bacterium]|jgi:capsular exopolysaccharide synthesis family protein